MDADNTLIPAGEALAEIQAVLDRIDPDRSGLAPQARLGLVRLTRRVCARLEALKAVVTAEADQARAAETAAGTPLVSWLGTGEILSRREAGGAVRQARQLGQHPLVGQAAVTGRLGVGQAKAITGLLDSLAAQLDTAQQQHAEQVLVDLAGHLDADQLARSAGWVLAQVAPAEADEWEEQRLQRETETAYRQRSLRFFREGGSVRFDGSLPRLDAEAWIAQLDACAEHTRRTAIEARDPLVERPTPEQRRADALINLIHGTGRARQSTQPARPNPGTVGASRPPTDAQQPALTEPDDAAPLAVPGRARPVDDTPPPPTGRVLVTLDYHQLMAGAAGAGTLIDGTPLSAGELRRICCDAELIPVVLGAPSEVLDVGRTQRLVTPALRAALTVRDRGCVFPGCNTPPHLCEAHHLTPWWAGGTTTLSNLALLCHRHHPIIEPARHTHRDQWQLRITDDGIPETIPPARLDPHQTPIRHQHHPTSENRPPGPSHNTGPPT